MYAEVRVESGCMPLDFLFHPFAALNPVNAVLSVNLGLVIEDKLQIYFLLMVQLTNKIGSQSAMGLAVHALFLTSYQ